MKNAIRNVLAASILIISATACTNQTANEQATQQTETQQSPAADFQLKDEQQNALLKAYLELKDALVASNAKSAQEVASRLAQNLKNNPALAQASNMTDSIAASTELAQQRAIFTNLSNQLIPVFRKVVLSKGSFYIQFCPMANEGKGGYWMAAEEEVRNPYYGDEMLNCGEVKETIK